jgi:hypothetical protein
MSNRLINRIKVPETIVELVTVNGCRAGHRSLTKRSTMRLLVTNIYDQRLLVRLDDTFL